MFGQSSGMSGSPVLSPEVAAAKQIIPNNATGQEILDAWKAAQVANGRGVDEAFIADHRAHKI
jgi:hypothetical protein